MPWATSTRRQELPDDWPVIREHVLRRDGRRCTRVDDGTRCGSLATDVDHVRDRHDHSLSNLTSLCHPHHAQKTTAEGHQAMRQRREQGKHPTERHPGLR